MTQCLRCCSDSDREFQEVAGVAYKKVSWPNFDLIPGCTSPALSA